MSSIPKVLLAALAAFFLNGCSGNGGGGSRLTVYPVSGKITLSGAPVSNAIVMFSPKGQQPAATGQTDAEGKYQLTTYDVANDGAAEGEYLVMVIKQAAPAASASEPAGGHGAPRAHTAPARGKKAETASGSILPPKYSDRNSSDLAATVKDSGENKFDFDLKP